MCNDEIAGGCALYKNTLCIAMVKTLRHVFVLVAFSTLSFYYRQSILLLSNRKIQPRHVRISNPPIALLSSKLADGSVVTSALHLVPVFSPTTFHNSLKVSSLCAYIFLRALMYVPRVPVLHVQLDTLSTLTPSYPSTT